MGWLEFQKCCGCCSLTTGTRVIGCYVLIIGLISFGFSMASLTATIILALSEPDEWISILEYFLPGFSMIIDLLQGILGILLITFNKNAKYLSKLVFYMIVVCLTNLLVTLISIITDSSPGYFFIAALLALECYFILIVRSNQMQLERRLTNPIDVRQRGQLDHNSSIFAITDSVSHNPPPPPYEEVMRYGALQRSDIAVTLHSIEEDPSIDRIDIIPEPNSPSRQVETQLVASSSGTDNRNKDSSKEPECVIYDERQFTAINDTQIVGRRI